MGIFLLILALGLAYAWVKGHLDWVKPQAQVPKLESKVPMQAYENINRKYSQK